MFKSLLAIGFLILPVLFPREGSSAELTGDEKVYLAMGRLLEPRDDQEFTRYFIEDLRKDEAFYLEISTGSLPEIQARLKLLLKHEVKRALESPDYPLQHLPGLRAFLGGHSMAHQNVVQEFGVDAKKVFSQRALQGVLGHLDLSANASSKPVVKGASTAKVKQEFERKTRAQGKAGGSGDAYYDLLKDQKFSLAPGEKDPLSKSVFQYVQKRLNLMEKGKDAPLGPFLFDRLMKDNPEMAKAFEQVFFESDFLPFLKNPQAKFVSDPEYMKCVNHLADAAGKSLDPVVASLRENLSFELWEAQANGRSTFYPKAEQVRRILSESDPGRVRFDFYHYLEGDSKPDLAEPEFNRMAQIYLRHFVHDRDVFFREFSREPKMRDFLDEINWERVFPTHDEKMKQVLEEFFIRSRELRERLLSKGATAGPFPRAFARAVRSYIGHFDPPAVKAEQLLRIVFHDFNHALTLKLKDGDSHGALALKEDFEEFVRWTDVSGSRWKFRAKIPFVEEVNQFKKEFGASFPGVNCGVTEQTLKGFFKFSGN